MTIGPSMMELPEWPHYDADEIAAVTDVLRGGRVNYWTGRLGREFESAFADYIGTRYAVAVANGTVALELALRALRIGPGDEVVVTPRSFVASASCVVNVGARPVFADVDKDSQNLTSTSIARVLSDRTRAVIPVHLAGWPCDMPAIMRLAEHHGLLVIEDCAQSLGGEIDGIRVGSFGHAAAFSFCQDKIMTTGGEGGMLITDDESVYERAWSYKDHGKNPEKVRGDGTGPAFRWVHDSIGTNWRMTEMQAAIGLAQLLKLEGWLARRAANATLLRSLLSGITLLRIPVAPDGIRHAWYKFYAFIEPARMRAGWNQIRILQALRDAGIPVMAGSCGEIYREQAFVDAGCIPADTCANAAELAASSLMFPVHPTLEPMHIEFIADRVTHVCKGATG